MIQINFDGKSKNYDEHMKNTGHYLAQQILIKRCLQKIKEPILDVSCGTGVILNTLENYFLQLIGNDDSKKMIEIAKSKTKTTKYICNDLMKINENKKYNTIICANTLFYFKDKLKTIAKLKKLVSKIGIIILIDEFPFIMPKGKLNYNKDDRKNIFLANKTEYITIIKNQILK